MKKILLFVCCLGMLMGCAPIQPALTVSEGDVIEAFPVKGRQGWLINQKLKFGDYQTSRIKRSWTRGGDASIGVPVGGNRSTTKVLSFGKAGRHQNFYFQMNDIHGNYADVFASSDFRATDLSLGSTGLDGFLKEKMGVTLSSENIFFLELFFNSEDRPWQLMLDNEAAQVHARRYRGVFVLDDENFYLLEPITRVAGKKGPTELIMGSIGYEILNKQNELIAAVSLVDGGNVYLNTKDPQERFLMANLCAALLLQENLAEY